MSRSDTFNRADSSSSLGSPSDGGSAYAGSSGTFGISSNRAYAPGAVGTGLGSVRVLDAGSADAEVQFTIVTKSNYWSAALRWTDDSNFDAAFFDTSSVQFYKVVGGTVSSFGSLQSVAWADGDVVKVTVSSTTYNVYRNGSLVLGPVTHSSANAGTYHGFGVFSNTFIRIDDLTITTSGGGGGALTAGTPIQVCTAAAVTIYCDGTNGSTASTGGAGSNTYQWYASATSNFTPGVGNLIGGATSANLTVSSPDTTLRFYKRIVTDSAAATATTVEAPGRLLDGALKILFVGDSLYYNTPTSGSPPPTNFTNFAAYVGGRIHSVSVINGGAPGSGVNYWLESTNPAFQAWPDGGPPDTDGTPLIEWFGGLANTAGVTTAIVRLGANDASIAAATWGTRLSAIVTSLFTRISTLQRVLLNYPTYGRPGGSYGGASNARFQEFQAQIDGLVNGTTICLGDRKQWDASAVITGWRQDDIHPSDEGARQLAEADIVRLGEILYPASGSGGVRRIDFNGGY